MRRQRIKSDEFIVQEVNGMHVVKVYFEISELSDILKEKLSESDRERFKDIHAGDRICQFRIEKHQPHLNFVAVESLDGNDRGGFGTTGVK